MRVKAKNRIIASDRHTCYSLSGNHRCEGAAAYEVEFPSGDKQYLCQRHFEIARDIVGDMPGDDRPEVRRI